MQYYNVTSVCQPASGGAGPSRFQIRLCAADARVVMTGVIRAQPIITRSRTSWSTTGGESAWPPPASHPRRQWPRTRDRRGRRTQVPPCEFPWTAGPRMGVCTWPVSASGGCDWCSGGCLEDVAAYHLQRCSHHPVGACHCDCNVITCLLK